MLSMLNQAAALIVNSEFTKAEYIGLGVKNENFVKIHPGVDVGMFNQPMRIPSIVTEHNLQGKKILLTVGRLVGRKGHDTVIKALPRILKQVPDVVYVIVGQGPMEAKLRELVRENNLTDRAIFTGFVPDGELPDYYRACDLFVMPSREIDSRERVEGFGIVFLEANASGKPVIGGRSGGVNEAIVDGVSGLLVDPLDVKALADAVVGLLLDPDRTRRLGIQGRKRVEQEFDWRIQAEKLRDLLDVL
jgi:phosphatidylinositol alpha-1,6-mannosyltransferase